MSRSKVKLEKPVIVKAPNKIRRRLKMAKALDKAKG